MYSIGSSAKRGFAGSPTYDDEYAFDNRAGFGLVPVVAVASIAGSLIHSSAAGPNRDAAEQVMPLAQAGNLTAIAAIYTRTGIQTVSSAAPWKAAFQELQASHPDWVAQAQPMASWSRFGAIQPQQVLAAVSGANAVYAKSNAATGGVPGSPNQPGATGYASPTLSGFTSTLFSPLGVGLAIGLYLLMGRKR